MISFGMKFDDLLRVGEGLFILGTCLKSVFKAEAKVYSLKLDEFKT